MKLSNLASSLSFAHLLGRERPIGLTANIRADDSDDENDDAMKGRKSKAKGSRADDDTGEDGDGNETDRKGKSARAEDDEEREHKEEEDERKSKRAKSKARAEDREREEEEDGDEREQKAMARGARQERARCKSIFACEGAGVRPDMAAHFAFNTTMSAEEAVGTLNAFAEGSSRGGKQSLDRRMESVQTPNPGSADLPPPDMSTAQGTAAAMVSVYNGVMGRGGQS